MVKAMDRVHTNPERAIAILDARIDVTSPHPGLRPGELHGQPMGQRAELHRYQEVHTVNVVHMQVLADPAQGDAAFGKAFR